jgi:hypothetical protein
VTSRLVSVFFARTFAFGTAAPGGIENCAVNRCRNDLSVSD